MEALGIQYQKWHRDIPNALDKYMADYEEIIRFLSAWSDIPCTTAFQSDLFSDPTMPMLLSYMISQRRNLGPILSPKYGLLALHAACPVPGCGLADRHGRLNEYKESSGHNQNDGAITFHCPQHGPHTIYLSNPEEVARVEANESTRSLLRGMTRLLDTTTHHIRVMGADYAGMYQETFLYRPILYVPLVVDWSGAKLSNSIYVREDGYVYLKQLGMDGLCSYAQLRERFDGDGGKGLRRIWDEVQRWMRDPKKLFRPFSLAYL
ncbi:hypothetical protein F5B20DRAFT_538253, partial [Whalleya microplaca]